MVGKTFSEKLFSLKTGKEVRAGEIVYAEPDLILSHDNAASIAKTFKQMGGTKVRYPSRLVIVLDHDSPPTNEKIANDHKIIREFVKEQQISNFYDEGRGICHQLMANHVLPGMLVVGSDSHTCTSGAFSAFAAGIDRTETAGLWFTGKTWFRVPETIKIELKGEFPLGTYAKDLALLIMNMIGSAGATYKTIEFHGEGVKKLSISERMTLANLASEMGAKTAVFPPDRILTSWLKEKHDVKFAKQEQDLIWSDKDAKYCEEILIELDTLEPLIAAPHQVDNTHFVREFTETKIDQAFLGTCTNSRLDDLSIAANLIKGKKVKKNVQFLVAPASQEIFKQALNQGIIQELVDCGAIILSCSCGPCLGKGQGIPADGWNVISTANRNFLGRMGNKKASIFLASPATVAASAITGRITDPRDFLEEVLVHKKASLNLKPRIETTRKTTIDPSDNRYINGVWDYSDVNNFNTDQMFAGTLTYDIKSTQGEKIVPFLFKGLDETFAQRVSEGDIIIAGENFGCGSSREHPAVGLAHVGIKAVIVKSVSRIFYRSAINQGLPIIVHSEFVTNYKRQMKVSVDLENGKIWGGNKEYTFPKLPTELLKIFNAGGLIKYYQKK